MKQQVSPAVAAVIVVVIVGIVAFFGFRLLRSPAGSQAGQAPPAMPPDVAAEFQKRMGGTTGLGAATGPRSTRGPAGMPMGVPTGPPGGNAGQ